MIVDHIPQRLSTVVLVQMAVASAPLEYWRDGFIYVINVSCEH